VVEQEQEQEHGSAATIKAGEGLLITDADADRD